MLQDPLFLLVAAAILITLVILVTGIGIFGKGGELNRKYANKLMRMRIVAQAVSVLLILVFIALRGSS